MENRGGDNFRGGSGWQNGIVAGIAGAVVAMAALETVNPMMEPDGKPFTAHTTNPVPFLVIGDKSVKLREGGRLADIAPTMLKLLGLPQPAEMNGKSIIE